MQPFRDKKKNINNNITVYGNNFLGLEIPVNKKVKSIKISLSEVNFLHLSSIYLKINEKWKKINENTILNAQQSSLYKNDERFDINNVIKNKSSFFSTKKEKAPWVIIEFKKAFNIEKIGLVNRSESLLWDRANTINVSISEDTDLYNKIFDAIDGLSRNNLIQKEISALRYPVITDPKIKSIKIQLDNLDKSIKMNDIFLMDKYANYLVEIFYSILQDNYDLLLKNKDWIINIFKNILFPIMNMYPKIILLLIAMAIIDKKNKEAFLIYKECSKDWSTDEKKDAHDLISKIGNILYGYPLILSTHTIVRPIRSWPQNLLLNTLFEIQKACSIDEIIDSFVCYGTLLGIYRDGDFIEHDDDMDMLIVLENKVNIDVVVHILVKELEKKKLKTKVAITNKQKYPFIQVFDTEHKVWTDIFIGFIENDEISLPMQNVNYFSIPKNLLFPRQQFEFGGFILNVPNNIPEFLEYRYGKNWKTPDRFFRNNEKA